MKALLILTIIFLIPLAYSQEGSPAGTSADSPDPTPSDTPAATATIKPTPGSEEENIDPAKAIKNNFAIGPYNREGKYEPSANLPEEKYLQQAMEETPELMPEPTEDN